MFGGLREISDEDVHYTSYILWIILKQSPQKLHRYKSEEVCVR